MTKKIINVVLSIVLLLLPIVIIPPGIAPSTYNIPKVVLLYTCGIILGICLCIKHKELKFDKPDKILLIFILLIGISTIFSIDIEQSILGSPNRYEGLLTFICYYLIYYATKYYANFSTGTLKNFLLIAFITSFLAILQYYNVPIIYDIFKSKYTGDSFAASTFGNRNFFASFASIYVPLTMCLYIFYNKKIYLAISTLSFYAMLASLTRSAWVAFGVISIIGIIYIIKQKDKKMIKRAFILLLVFIATFLIFYFTKPDLFLGRYITSIKDLKSLTTEREKANSLDLSTKFNPAKHTVGAGRSLLWASAFEVIKANPLTGCGTDSFGTEILENHKQLFYNKLYPAFKSLPDKVHNEYLQIAATNGLPCFIAYLVFLFITLKNLTTYKFMKNKKAFIVFLCLISYLVQAFFNISTIGVAPIFYLLLGYSYRLRKNQY